MVDFATEQAAWRIGGIEAIALGEEVFERAGLRLEGRAYWMVGAAQQGRRRSVVTTFAEVTDFVAVPVAAHVGPEIRKMEPGAGDGDGDGIGSIEAEEPDAGFAAERYIGADVHFGKSGEPRKRGSGAETDARHAERNDAEPSLTFVEVKLQGNGDKRDPWRHRDGPGPVRGFREGRVHGGMQSGSEFLNIPGL